MRISMAGDDCSLHFDLDTLTAKQQQDHASNQVLTGMLQVALHFIAKPTDTVCLYDTFRTESWAADGLARYRAMFTRMGLAPPDEGRCQYHPREGFYESVAATPTDAVLENLYMTSGSNQPLHKDPVGLEVSRNLNSKVHFAAHAPAFGIPVPATLHCRKADLDGEKADAFVRAHGLPMMLKILGLAGARNVVRIDSLDEAHAWLAEYDDDLDLILQAWLDPAQWQEMTVDLFVSNDDIHITNVRQILFADGLWVGNLMGPDVRLSPAQTAALLDVGRYAQAHGYRTETGFNLGIDYFVARESTDAAHRLLVTEINARWTGGLFPAELVRRLNVSHEQVVAFIDLCPPARFGDYLNFVEHHLHPRDAQPFSIAPMGFAPFASDVEGTDYLYVWQIVIGDFEAFKAAKQTALGDDVLITAPIVSVGL